MFGTVVFLALAAAAGIWHFAGLRERLHALRQPLTSLAQYRASLTAGDSHLTREEWIDCPVCECATIDRLSPVSVCPICDWEYAPEPSRTAVEQARVNFDSYGSVNTPEEILEWGGVVPDAEVLAAKRAAADVCRRAREGATSFAEALDELAHFEQLILAAHDRHAEDAGSDTLGR